MGHGMAGSRGPQETSGQHSLGSLARTKPSLDRSDFLGVGQDLESDDVRHVPGTRTRCQMLSVPISVPLAQKLVKVYLARYRTTGPLLPAVPRCPWLIFSPSFLYPAAPAAS